MVFYNRTSLFLGLRLLRSQRRGGLVSLVGGVTFIALALGVAILIVVMSVMNGFDAELRRRILTALPHAELRFAADSPADWRALAGQVEAHPEVQAAVPFTALPALLAGAGGAFGTELRAVLPQEQQRLPEAAFQDAALERLVPGAWRILLGQQLAFTLGVEAGDTVTAYLPEAVLTPFGPLPRSRQFEVAGLVQVGAEPDRYLALIHLADGRALARLGAEAGGLQLYFNDALHSGPVLAELLEALPPGHAGSDWRQRHGALFRAVAIEKITVFLLLCFVMLVAVFNLVSALHLLVDERRPAIALLTTLGMERRSVFQVFLWQGLLSAFGGIAAGAALGIPLALHASAVIAFFEDLAGLRLFSPNVYYIERLPSLLLWQDTLLVLSVASLLSLGAVLLAVRHAAAALPATVLR